MPAPRGIGTVCGALTVSARLGMRGVHVLWSARCVCGEEQPADSRTLARGYFAACSCPGRQKPRKGHAMVVAIDPGSEALPQPVRSRKPLAIPLHAMIRIGRELGLTSDEAMNPERLSRAARRDDPSHPGFVELGRKLRTLGHGLTAP